MIDPSSKSDCCGQPVNVEIYRDGHVQFDRGIAVKVCSKCGEICNEVNPDPEPPEPILTDDGVR